MPPPPVVALEIGTSKVVALVAEPREDGRTAILGMGLHASKGVRKGEVVDLENATACVRAAIQDAEASGQVTIRRVYLALTGGHIQSQANRGTIRIASPNGGITAEDMEQVMDVARGLNLPQDRELLHSLCRRYAVDDQQHVTNPLGLSGARLSLDVLAIHGVRSRLQNAVHVVDNAQLEVQDVAFSGLCAGLAVLSQEQKERGALVIDLGGGTTNYVAFVDKAVADAGVLAVGGDHVTNDISLAFTVSQRQAESLKLEHGHALVEGGNRTRRVDVPAEVGFSARSVSLAALHTVIGARVRETLELIRARLDRSDIDRRFGAGLILTGGAARLPGIQGLAEGVFGLPCRVGAPCEVDGLAAVTGGPEYAVAVGLARYGLTTAQNDSAFSFRRLFQSLLGH